MTGKAHTIQAAVVSVVAFRFLTTVETVVLFLSIIFIDLDHYLDFIVVTRRYDPRDMFKYHGWLFYQREKIYGLNVFHTAECAVLLLLLGFWSRYFWIILAGFIIHYIADLIHLRHHKMLFARAFSIIEYVLMRKRTTRGYPMPNEGFWD